MHKYERYIDCLLNNPDCFIYYYENEYFAVHRNDTSRDGEYIGDLVEPSCELVGATLSELKEGDLVIAQDCTSDDLSFFLPEQVRYSEYIDFDGKSVYLPQEVEW